jgi:RNA polymerase sigma-B factor
VSPHAELQALPDAVLLARLRGAAEREPVCEVLVTRYAGLIRSWVRRYRRSPEPAEGLMQVGYVGPLEAINDFGPRNGISLIAYALRYVGGEIKRHFRARRWQVRVGSRPGIPARDAAR